MHVQFEKPSITLCSHKEVCRVVVWCMGFSIASWDLLKVQGKEGQVNLQEAQIQYLIYLFIYVHVHTDPIAHWGNTPGMKEMENKHNEEFFSEASNHLNPLWLQIWSTQTNYL